MFKLIFVSFLLLFCLSSVFRAQINNLYVVDDIVHFSNKNGQGIFAVVNYTGNDTYYQKVNSTIVQRLNVTIVFDSDNEFTVTMDDADSPRFRLPYQEPYAFTKPGSLKTPLYNINIEQSPFSINVVRNSTGEVIFDTAQFNLIYSNYYINFGVQLPSEYLYGLGERRRDFLYDSGLYTIWNKDQYTQIDSGTGSQQTYGCHPMYLMRENSGNWHVVYLRNSNAMDFQFDASAKTLEYFITGSIIELKFFFGSSKKPEDVLKLYHNYANGWTLMPFWSHGYHQSKYGIIYLQDMLDALSNFTTYRIPIDVMWSDIDYMYSFTDFTIDDQRYNITELKQMAEKIHWVPILDAGISLNTSADSYNLGMQNNVFIKSGTNNTNPLVGGVWPGVVHWPDWLHPNTSEYWRELLTSFHDQTPFSGIWLDMNENSNFCEGEYPINCNLLSDYLPDGAYPNGNIIIPPNDQNPDLQPSSVAWFNSDALPYLPGNTRLEDKSISINALHYGDLLEFNMHNTNGMLESKITYQILQNITEERPFILSRSTHVGSGKYVAHWSGDNYADWNFLSYSVSCIFNFQLYGIPMSGDDICGFAGNTTVELCSRWMQLGAFYPFMRNHMAIGTIDHYPYSLGDTVLQASLASLKLRYSILKHYYAQFVREGGVGTVFKPVFFEFPDDTSLLSLDTQFLIGKDLMAAAVTEPGQTQVDIYFPTGTKWYNLQTFDLVYTQFQDAATLSFDAPLNGSLPLFVRGGAIIPIQNVDVVQSTRDLNNIFNLIIAFTPVDSVTDVASGIILGIANYSDDASVDQCTGQSNCLININATSVVDAQSGIVTLTYVATADNAYTILEDIYIANVTFTGIRTQVCNMTDQNCLSQSQASTWTASATKLVLNQKQNFQINITSVDIGIDTKTKSMLKIKEIQA